MTDVTVVIYFYAAVILQSGVPAPTVGVPQPSMEACQELKAKIDAAATAETHVKDPDNAKSFVTLCVPMALKTPSV